MTPRLMPTTRAVATARKTSRRVTGAASSTIAIVDCPVRNEVRWPVSSEPSIFTYWTGSGSSSPSWWRSACCCSGVACETSMSRAVGSPGARRTTRKEMIEIPIRTGTAWISRRRTYPSICTLRPLLDHLADVGCVGNCRHTPRQVHRMLSKVAVAQQVAPADEDVADALQGGEVARWIALHGDQVGQRARRQAAE